MIIEFTGCTGSGKTTISARVAEKLANAGRNVYPLPPLKIFGSIRIKNGTIQNIVMDIISLRWIFSSLGDNRVLLRHAYSIIRKNRKLFSGRRCAVNLLRSVIRKLGVYRFLRSQRFNNIIAVVDEGIVHSVHNIFVYPDNPPDESGMMEFAGLLPLPDLIIYIKAPEEVLISRALKRPDPPIKGPAEEMKRFVRNAETVFGKVMSLDRIRDITFVVDCYGDDDNFAEIVSDRIVRSILKD